MSKETVYFKECCYDYEVLKPGQAYLLKPSSWKYKMEIVLIVRDSKTEQYTMMLFIDDELEKEINFIYKAGISVNYDNMYRLGVRLIDNNLKTRESENTETISKDSGGAESKGV